MRRILLITIVAFMLFAILGTGVGFSMSQDGPFQPGNPLFPYQYFAEQQRAGLIAGDTERAIFLIHLAGVRAEVLMLLAGTPDEELALGYLSQACDQALQALRSVPADELPALHAYLVEMAEEIDIALGASLNPNPALSDLRLNFEASQGLLAAYNPANSPVSNSLCLSLARPSKGNKSEDGASSPESQLIDAHVVSFPQGSSGAAHEFFPLTDQLARRVSRL